MHVLHQLKSKGRAQAYGGLLKKEFRTETNGSIQWKKRAGKNIPCVLVGVYKYPMYNDPSGTGSWTSGFERGSRCAGPEMT